MVIPGNTFDIENLDAWLFNVAKYPYIRIISKCINTGSLQFIITLW